MSTEPSDYEPYEPEEREPDDWPDYDYEPDNEPEGDYEPDEDLDWNDNDALVLQQEEFYREAVSNFTRERLCSYYINNPDVAAPAMNSLKYAETLLQVHPRAALVFAVTAIELTLKSVLLRPIISGLVHTEALAALITELSTTQTGIERFEKLLKVILQRYGNCDLNNFKRTPKSKTLWQEIAEVQKERNKVVHRGELVEESTAKVAVAVAGTLLTKIYPSVLSELGIDSSIKKPV